MNIAMLQFATKSGKRGKYNKMTDVLSISLASHPIRSKNWK
uniref:Putative LOC101165370 [Oryzias latipes] n=1 Tax=Lepeophtheirus salmonis TaxID=72036 RepID=A0A0K2UVX9_LEPSM